MCGLVSYLSLQGFLGQLAGPSEARLPSKVCCMMAKKFSGCWLCGCLRMCPFLGGHLHYTVCPWSISLGLNIALLWMSQEEGLLKTIRESL